MKKTCTDSDSATLLSSVRARREAETQAVVDTYRAVLAWIRNPAHHASADETAELLDPDVEPGLHLGGPGCPVIAEYAALDLALSLGMSSDAGLAWLGKALEVAHRLPRLHARVLRGEVALWKAFRVAATTQSLPAAGAEFVDRHLARVLHRCSFAQVERTVAEARARFDPDEARRRAEAAAEGRRADLDLTNPDASLTGTVEMRAVLDTADALDLEHALRDGAQALADLGSTETLDVRRSQALGEMARNQPTLDLDTGELTQPARPAAGGGRGVTLYIHLDVEHAFNADAAETDGGETPPEGDGDGGQGLAATGTLDNTRNPVTLDQIRAWCQTAGTKVTVKPVIDLAADPVVGTYRPSTAIGELVRLRDRTCVFPHCRRTVTDLDHIEPYDHQHPRAGGQTRAHNLALLCRRHHRAKTHGRWTYEMTQPGLFEWTSPTGHHHTVDRRPPGRRSRPGTGPPRRRRP